MFFPTSPEIINRRWSHRRGNNENKKIDADRLSKEDEIRKTYGDNLRLIKIHGEAYLRNLYGYNKIIKSVPKGKKPKLIRFVKGEKLRCGVRGFLSNHGKTTQLVRFQFEEGVLREIPVDFDSLSGKYVLICCFDLPMLSVTPIATHCRSLIDAYKSKSYDFEMVVVAKMRTDIVYELKAAFDHFYSAFSCLAIPFSHFETRDYIHLSMNLSGSYAFLVNPEGLVLHNSRAVDNFFYYGIEFAPPFSPRTLDTITKQDEVLRSSLDPMYETPAYLSRFSYLAVAIGEVRQRPLSLSKDILLCRPGLPLSRFDADTDQHTTVKDLSSKYVGLYLFIDGDILEVIKAAHDHCLANNQQLEIVLVPMPFYDEPESHDDQLRQALRLFNIKSWFLYNCPNMVCRRLWRVFGQGVVSPNEKFIIIPPDCKSGELCGREVLINFGVDQYPFTRTAILKPKLEYVRSLTPIFSSLFNNCQMIQNGQEFKSEQLQGKNVLLHLSWTQYDRCSLVKKHYPNIKAMGWEVVFVLLDYTDRHWNQKCVGLNTMRCQKWPCFNLDEMPWPYMILSAAAGVSIKKLFFPIDTKTDYIFAVGKDGKIVSRDVERRLNIDGVTESLFDDVLEADLNYVLATMHLWDLEEY